MFVVNLVLELSCNGSSICISTSAFRKIFFFFRVNFEFFVDHSRLCMMTSG